jgi:tetratricopeptide (TPR) repeat protein
MSKKNKAVNTPQSSSNTSKTQNTDNQTNVQKNNDPIQWYWICVGILVFSVIAAFSGGFNNEFVNWDDQTYVKLNPIVIKPNGHWTEAWSSHVALNYHPLTITSLMINSDIFGVQSARSFIITNTLIHLLNVLFVFYFILLLLKKSSEITLPKSGKPLFVAFFTALLFAIHPMRVESVTWVSERKDVLYSFFFLAGCINYLKYLDSEKNRKFLIYCFFLFLASCLSKGQAVVLPLVFLLLDYWRERKFERNVFIEKIPFLAISLLFGLIATNIQSGGNFYGLLHGIGQAGFAMVDSEKVSIAKNFTYAGYGFMMYCYHFFLPFNLSSFYLYNPFENIHIEYFLGLLLMIAIIGFGIYNLGRNKVIFFGIGFFVITIILVLQILQVGLAIMADRYTYLPYIGFFFMLSMFLWGLYERQSFQKYLSMGFIGAFSIMCFLITRKQVEVWQDTITLFKSRLTLNPEDYRGHYNLGEAYVAKENLDGAISEFSLAIEQGWKENIAPWANLATAYEKQGNYIKAIEYHDQIIKKDSATAETYMNRGNAYLNAQMPEKALPDLEKALNMPKLKDKVLTRGSLATAQLNVGQAKEALENYNIVIDKEGSKNPEYFYNRGVAKNKFGDNLGAITDIKQCVMFKPDHIKANEALKLLGVK